MQKAKEKRKALLLGPQQAAPQQPDSDVLATLIRIPVMGPSPAGMAPQTDSKAGSSGTAEAFTHQWCGEQLGLQLEAMDAVTGEGGAYVGEVDGDLAPPQCRGMVVSEVVCLEGHFMALEQWTFTDVCSLIAEGTRPMSITFVHGDVPNCIGDDASAVVDSFTLPEAAQAAAVGNCVNVTVSYTWTEKGSLGLKLMKRGPSKQVYHL